MKSEFPKGARVVVLHNCNYDHDLYAAGDTGVIVNGEIHEFYEHRFINIEMDEPRTHISCLQMRVDNLRVVIEPDLLNAGPRNLSLDD